MIVPRRYVDADYEQVKELVNKTMPRQMPERLGGCGVVLEEDGKIFAFCWALTAPDSEIACVEFFTVEEEKRAQKIHGPMVITKLLMELQSMGVKEVVGLLVSGEPYTESLTKIYHEVGMTANAGYVVNGAVETILTGIRKRYLNEVIE